MAQQIGPNTWEFEIPGGQKVRGNGGSEQEARRDAKSTYNRMATAPPPGISTGTPEQRKQQDIVGKVKEALLGPPVTGAELGGDIRDPKTLLTGARAMAQQVTPGSIPEAAVMAVLPFAGKFAGAAVGAGTDLASQIGRVAARVAAPTAAGAAAGAATGGKEGAAQGAELGLTASATGEAFRGTGSLVEAAARKWGNLDTQAYNTRVANVLGPELGHRIEKDIPSLAGKVSNVSDVIKLTDEKTGGLRVIGDKQDAVEKRIVTSLGNTVVGVPQEAVDMAKGTGPASKQATAGAQGQVGAVTGGMTGLTDRTPEQAVQLAKVLRQKGAKAQGPDRAAYFAAREQVLDSLVSKANPKLTQEYEAVRGDYRKMVKLNDFLTTTTDKLFPSAAAGRKPTIDLLLFGDRTIQNFADVSPSDFPAVHEMFTGPGGAAGTRPAPGAAIPLLGHARASTPVPGMSGVRAYEGGRFATKERLPQHLQDKVGTNLGEKIAAVGRATAAGATPSISEAQQ